MQSALRNITFILLGSVMIISPAIPISVAADVESSSRLSSDIAWETGGSLRLRYEWKQGFAFGKPGAVDGHVPSSGV